METLLPHQQSTGKKVGVSAWFTTVCICNALIEKILYNLKPAHYSHTFTKPWFFTCTSMLGISLGLVPYYFDRFIHKEENKSPWPTFRNAVKLFIPGILELFQCLVSSITVAYIGVSIDYMLRSGTTIGVALISRFYFKRKFKAYEIFSIIVVLIGMILIGVAGFLNNGTSSFSNVSKTALVAIIIVKLLSQIGYAVKLSIEEFMTQAEQIDSSFVSGMEGVWSFLVSAAIIMPIIQFLPEGPFHEDFVDTWRMLTTCWSIPTVLFIALFFDCMMNLSSVVLTEVTSAVARTLIENLGTFLIWLVEIGIYYLGPRIHPSLRAFGEEWGKGSILQIAGYVLMLIGLVQFHKYPKMCCFDYGEDVVPFNLAPKDPSIPSLCTIEEPNEAEEQA